MSVPANALSDEECLHYAAIDPEAAVELTRRITMWGLDPSAESEELRQEIQRLEYRADESESEADELRDYIEQAATLIKRAMSPEERELSVNELLQKALERLE